MICTRKTELRRKLRHVEVAKVRKKRALKLMEQQLNQLKRSLRRLKRQQRRRTNLNLELIKKGIELSSVPFYFRLPKQLENRHACFLTITLVWIGAPF